MRSLTVCGRSIADFTIVRGSVPAPAEKTAAEFLQRVIAASCGVTLHIADTAEHGIYIGTRAPSPEVKSDGFRITSDDRNLYLDGNIPRGTLYAAYEFAEIYLDYRMFAPDCEIIPTEGEGNVPQNLDRINNPGIEARHIGCHSQQYHPEFATHCRANDAMGGMDETWGGCTHATDRCHTLGARYLSGKVYFKEHPEYDYLDLFCSGKEEAGMTAEEKQAYLDRVKKFKEDKVKYNFHWSIFTGNKQGR